MSGEDEKTGGTETEAWYEGRSGDGPRPWELATGEDDAPSLGEYLRRQREEGMSRRDLALTVAGTLLLVLIPAALVGSILTLFVLSLVDDLLLWWVGLTLGVLVLMLAASELI
ncbi:MAG: hypothetical protein ABEH47_01405 [Haloferacaceae archaeon]